MSVFFIISVVLSVFDTPFSRNIGLAEKVGNVPGVRRPSKLGLPAVRGAASSASLLVAIAIGLFFFFPRLKPKTRILASKVLDSFSAGIRKLEN